MIQMLDLVPLLMIIYKWLLKVRKKKLLKEKSKYIDKKGYDT